MINGKLYGKYRFRNYVTLPTGSVIELSRSEWIHNLITKAGRTYFLTRLKENNSGAYAPISHMVVGTSSTDPNMDDTYTAITEGTGSRQAVSSAVAGSPDWKTTFTATFTSSQINNTTDIGLINASSGAGTLVTRSKHGAVSIPTGSSMAIDYIISLTTSMVVTGWAVVSGKANTFQATIASALDVHGVNEPITFNGYAVKTNSADVQSTVCSYWHDKANNILYIHPSDGVNPDTSGKVIIVTTGE